MTGEDSGESGSYSEAIGTRLTSQTNRQFQAYKEENELGDAEALRRIVRQGLKDEEEEQENRLVEATVFGATSSAFFLIAFGLIEGALPFFGAAIVLFAVAILANKFNTRLARLLD